MSSLYEQIAKKFRNQPGLEANFESCDTMLSKRFPYIAATQTKKYLSYGIPLSEILKGIYYYLADYSLYYRDGRFSILSIKKVPEPVLSGDRFINYFYESTQPFIEWKGEFFIQNNGLHNGPASRFFMATLQGFVGMDRTENIPYISVNNNGDLPSTLLPFRRFSQRIDELSVHEMKVLHVNMPI